MFVIALLTGMRAGEVRELRKGDVDLKNRLITVRTKKGISAYGSGRTREIPVSDEVFHILLRRDGSAEGDCLFPGNDPNKPLAEHRETFRRACERAGIPYGLDGNLIFNDARRTAENRMLDAGHSPRAVADIEGHSYETRAKHYARSTPQSRKEAVETLKNFGAKEQGNRGI